MILGRFLHQIQDRAEYMDMLDTIKGISDPITKKQAKTLLAFYEKCVGDDPEMARLLLASDLMASHGNSVMEHLDIAARDADALITLHDLVTSNDQVTAERVEILMSVIQSADTSITLRAALARTLLDKLAYSIHHLETADTVMTLIDILKGFTEPQSENAFSLLREVKYLCRKM